MLGRTGAGKSTFTHFLCGSKMAKLQNKEGISYIGPENVKNPELNSIRVSPSSVSETLNISPVTFEYIDEYGDNKGT